MINIVWLGLFITQALNRMTRMSAYDARRRDYAIFFRMHMVIIYVACDESMLVGVGRATASLGGS